MRGKSRFYADYVPPDSFSDKEWFEPLRTGVRWFYHVPRRQPKIVAKEVTTTIDRPLVPLLEAATQKGLRTLPSCAGHEYDANYVKRLQKQLLEDQRRVNTTGLVLRNTETGQQVLWQDPSYSVALHSLRDIDKKLKEQHNHGYIGIQGDPARLAKWEAAMRHIPYTQVDKRGSSLNIRVRSPNRKTQQTAWAQVAHAARVNPRDYTDPEQNKRIIERWLSSAPSDWRRQFESGVADLRATGQASGSLSLNLTNALKVLGITAGGNRSNDTASGGNIVPPAVREEAMHGLALSHANNYGAWNFIGIARAIQLATQPGVSSTTLGRMRNYFSRHRKDKRSSGFGDDRSPSRGYMAWLNWGGDAGQAWVSGSSARNNPMNERERIKFFCAVLGLIYGIAGAWGSGGYRTYGYPSQLLHENIGRWPATFPPSEQQTKNEIEHFAYFLTTNRPFASQARQSSFNEKVPLTEEEANKMVYRLLNIAKEKFSLLSYEALEGLQHPVSETNEDYYGSVERDLFYMVKGTELEKYWFLPPRSPEEQVKYYEGVRKSSEQIANAEALREARRLEEERWPPANIKYPKGVRVPEGREDTLERLRRQKEGIPDPYMKPGKFGIWAHVFNFKNKIPRSLSQWKHFLRMKRELAVSDLEETKSIFLRRGDDRNKAVGIFEGTTRLQAEGDVWSYQDSSGMRIASTEPQAGFTPTEGKVEAWTEGFLSPANAKMKVLVIYRSHPYYQEIKNSLDALGIPVIDAVPSSKSVLYEQYDEEDQDDDDEYYDYVPPIRKQKRNPDGSDPQGRLIPEKYLAGLPPELRAQRERELGESRDAYWRGDFTPPETDRIARSMGLVKLSPYRKEAMKRGFDVSQAQDDLSIVAEKALKHYTGEQPSAQAISELTTALQQVYRKGLAAWASGGHRPGASQKSWADARVASVLTGGRAAFTADKKEYAVLQRLINKRK